MDFSEEKLVKYKPLISLLAHKKYMHMFRKHPLLMAITCAYKGKVKTHVLLTKNE